MNAEQRLALDGLAKIPTRSAHLATPQQRCLTAAKRVLAQRSVAQSATFRKSLICANVVSDQNGVHRDGM
jgi:hypothetical protein